MNENELFQWGAAKIKEAIDAKMYGSITIRFENGRIVGSKTEKSDKPIVQSNKNM